MRSEIEEEKIARFLEDGDTQREVAEVVS